MPNHCDSDLTVTGPEDQLSEFLAKYVTEEDGTILNLDAIRQYPQEFKEQDRKAQEWEDGMMALCPPAPDAPVSQRSAAIAEREFKQSRKQYVEEHGPQPKDGFNSGGYEWCIQNWGTKWGCYKSYEAESPIERSEGKVILHFSTAWSPFNTDLLVDLSDKFPNLTFEYDAYEQGMQFQHHSVVQASMVLKDLDEPYKGPRGG